MKWIVDNRHTIVLVIMTVAIFGMTLPFIMFSASAQSTDLGAQEIVETVSPSEASEEQIAVVEEWFYANGDDLEEDLRNQVGSWLSSAQNSDSSSSSESSNESSTSENETTETPDDVVAEINDNLTLRDYQFSEEEGTVTLLIHASDRTEQVTLTDPASAGDSGVGDVNQQGVTVNREQTVEVEFPVGYSAYTGSATVWISAGAGDTIYVSNPTQELINRLEWAMIPAAGFAGALAVFVSGLIYVFRQYRSVNSEYTNVFKNI
mgnify:CR=1 FL=1